MTDVFIIYECTTPCVSERIRREAAKYMRIVDLWVLGMPTSRYPLRSVTRVVITCVVRCNLNIRLLTEVLLRSVTRVVGSFWETLQHIRI